MSKIFESTLLILLFTLFHQITCSNTNSTLTKTNQDHIFQYLQSIITINNLTSIDNIYRKNGEYNSSVQQYHHLLYRFTDIQISPQSYKLELLKLKNISIDNFILNKNQNHLEFLCLAFNEIDNQRWRMLVEHASSIMVNVKVLMIHRNCITQVRQGDLEKFPSLRFVIFYPVDKELKLTEQSIRVLERFQDNHPQIFTLYDGWGMKYFLVYATVNVTIKDLKDGLKYIWSGLQKNVLKTRFQRFLGIVMILRYFIVNYKNLILNQ